MTRPVAMWRRSLLLRAILEKKATIELRYSKAVITVSGEETECGIDAEGCPIIGDKLYNDIQIALGVMKGVSSAK